MKVQQQGEPSAPQGVTCVRSNTTLCNITLLVLAMVQIAALPTAESFSLSSSRYTNNIGTTHRHHHDVNSATSPPRLPSIASYASLRDLLNSSDNNNDKEKDPKNDDVSSGKFNFLNSGSEYSKKKFRDIDAPKKIPPTDEEDELGLHMDRLSTFSFASRGKQSKMSSPEAVVSSPPVVEGGTVEEVGTIAESEGGTGTPAVNKSIYDETLPDNYNNRGIFIHKTKYPSRSPRKADTVDHIEQLRTFSFGSKSAGASEGVTDTTPSPPSSKNRSSESSFKESDHADRLKTFSLSSQSDNIPPASAAASSAGASARPYDDHGDRLTTFSFASTAPKSGSTSFKAESASASAAAPRRSSAPDATTSTEGETKASDSDIPPNPTSPSAQHPARFSLSSLASSLYTQTRNDRIQEIKNKNDPRLLHPDGMNVPRLNSKGSIMSMSSAAGRPNIFQRIGVANERNGDGDYNSLVNAIEGGGRVENDEGVEGLGDTEYSGIGDLNGIEDDGRYDTLGETHGGDNLDDILGAGDCFIGFDLGTSGARMSIVEKKVGSENKWDYEEVFAASLAWDDILHYDDAYDWRAAVDTLLSRAKDSVYMMGRVKAICVSGTSASCLLLERGSLNVSRVARMYNYDINVSSSDNADRVMKMIDRFVPEKHTARAPTGSLAKLLLWNEEQPLVDDEGNAKEVLCHQSDYVSMSLINGGLEGETSCSVASDWHNCLKLGYDVRSLSYPSWMLDMLREGANISDPDSVLPSKVVSPGEPLGLISPYVAIKYNLPMDVVLVGGTTDSNAAFFAAAGANPGYGTAVTSLGSTLAMKQLSKTYVEDASRGVYSHRFPRFARDDVESEEAWLVGGASNVGCAVLRQEGFSNDELSQLSADIDPSSDSPLSYYPLVKKGERFPVADSEKEPVLDPKPGSRKEYLHGILQGIGDVERDGFRILGELGTTPNRPTIVLSCGGGSNNDAWIAMRERRLKAICDEGQNVVVKRATNTEASFGAALLAAASFE
eukprot:scaffold2569_cov197-Alexandrium_tamarense.AAC.11